MTYQTTIPYLQSQYRQLSESCEQWASFTTDPAFAGMLRNKAALFRQFTAELNVSAATATRQLKAAIDWLAAIYLQRDDILVASACYRAMKALINLYDKLLTDPTLPKEIQPVINRQYTVLNQSTTVLQRMMTV